MQDADRLDAMGAIGIARCFTYSGSIGTAIYDPEIHPVTLSATEYNKKDRKSTAVNHFYEKLFLLKDLMKTEKGKIEAIKRHEFMKAFIAQLETEVL